MVTEISHALTREITTELKRVEDGVAGLERKRSILQTLLQEYGNVGGEPTTELLQAESTVLGKRDHPHPHPEPAPAHIYEEVDLTGARNLNERLRRIGRLVCSEHGQSVNLTLAARLIIQQTQSIQTAHSMRSKVSCAVAGMGEYRRIQKGHYWYDEDTPPLEDEDH